MSKNKDFIDIEKNIGRQNEYISLLTEEIEWHRVNITVCRDWIKQNMHKESIERHEKLKSQIQSKKAIFLLNGEIESKINFIAYLKKYLTDCKKD